MEIKKQQCCREKCETRLVFHSDITFFFEHRAFCPRALIVDKSGNCIQAKLNGKYSTLRSGMYDFQQIALRRAAIVAFFCFSLLPLCFGSG